jgi:hypothetical protein
MPVNLPLLSNHLIGKLCGEASGALRQAFEILRETKPERGREKYFISSVCSSIAN